MQAASGIKGQSVKLFFLSATHREFLMMILKFLVHI
jgi:hypothetical protein